MQKLYNHHGFARQIAWRPCIWYPKLASFPPATSLMRRIALYRRSFDPPTRSQREDVQRLIEAGFSEVVICPLGPRSVAGEHQHAAPPHRAALVTLGFSGLANVKVDYDDLSHHRCSSPAELESCYASSGEVWHVTDEDHSHALDRELANDARRIVFLASDSAADTAACDKSRFCLRRTSSQTSAAVRERVYNSESIADWVVEAVAKYIQRHHLFVPYSVERFASFTINEPRVLIVADPRNATSTEFAEKYKKYQSDAPEIVLVLGGDGTMLHAIREHWRLRIPFVGLNTGHLGFLMNERLSENLRDLELVSYTLPMLRVDAQTPSGEHSWGLAFSDVWVERAEGQAAWLRLDVDGETRVAKVVGDGMLIATASGSSAYARAMGAVPVPLNTPAITLAGSNIFQPRFWKPMALPDDSLVTIANLDQIGKRPIRGYIDGTPMGIVQQITVRRSLTASVELAFTREFDPSARLLRSLFPPNEMA